MRLLFDAERDRHNTDVLLATVFETLSGGEPRSLDELLRQIESDWPGVVITREKLESTLQVAEERGLLTTPTTLAGTKTWAITDLAALGVNDSKVWAQSVLDRCRTQIEDRAYEAGLSVNHEIAAHWTSLLLEVLHEGMIGSFTKRPNAVREVASRLFPPYDRATILSATKQRVDDEAVADFLSATALAALDPASTFGSEVVHYLATGYILYALLLGVDLVGERSELADFEGEVLLLDTPVLLRMLNSGHEFRWIADLVGRIASEAGAVVAVTARTRRELTEMLDRRDEDARKVEREIADGVPRANLAAVAPDEVLSIWLSDPRVGTWAQFKGSVDGVFTSLGAMGVLTDFIPVGFDLDVGERDQFADAIQTVIESRGRFRHQVPAEHDGEVLCVAAYLRAAWGERDDGSIWPGAWIVSPDRSLNDAYRTVAKDDPTPIALSISQAASLLAALAQPDDAEKLAELIANDLQWQARFERATGFGIDQAIQLARSFTSGDPDALLVEASATQLTLEGLLAEADYQNDPTAAARAAIVQQDRRRREAHGVQRSEAEAERVRERERASAEKARGDALERLSEKQMAILAESSERETSLAAETANLQASNRKLKRFLVTVMIYAVAIILVIAAWALGLLSWQGVLVAGAALAAVAKWFYDWIIKPEETLLGVVLASVAWVFLAGFGAALTNHFFGAPKP